MHVVVQKNVLRLQIAVHNAVVVEVCHGRQGRADQVRGVGLVVRALAADAVEELAAGAEVETEVEVVCGLSMDVRS